MSVIDDLRIAQQHALARLDELKPLAAEYEELRAEIERLNLIEPAAPSNGVAPVSTKPRAARSQKPRRPAGRRPGASASAASAASKPTTSTAANGAASAATARPAKRVPKPATATAAKRAAKAAAAPAAKSTTSTKARTPGGSRSSSRAEDVARLVAQQPGITVADLGRSLGVNATSLYNPVRRLVNDGRLRKEGTALHPAA